MSCPVCEASGRLLPSGDDARRSPCPTVFPSTRCHCPIWCGPRRRNATRTGRWRRTTFRGGIIRRLRRFGFGCSNCVRPNCSSRLRAVIGRPVSERPSGAPCWNTRCEATSQPWMQPFRKRNGANAKPTAATGNPCGRSWGDFDAWPFTVDELLHQAFRGGRRRPFQSSLPLWGNARPRRAEVEGLRAERRRLLRITGRQKGGFAFILNCSFVRFWRRIPV